MWKNLVPIKVRRGWFIISLEMPQGWSWSTWWRNMNKNLLRIPILVQMLRHCRLRTFGLHVLCNAHVGDSQTLSFTCKCRPPFTANFHKDHVSLIVRQAWQWPFNHFKTKARPMVLKCRGAQALRQQVRRIVGSLQKTKYQATTIDLWFLDPLELDLQMTRFPWYVQVPQQFQRALTVWIQHSWHAILGTPPNGSHHPPHELPNRYHFLCYGLQSVEFWFHTWQANQLLVSWQRFDQTAAKGNNPSCYTTPSGTLQRSMWCIRESY